MHAGKWQLLLMVLLIVEVSILLQNAFLLHLLHDVCAGGIRGNRENRIIAESGIGGVLNMQQNTT